MALRCSVLRRSSFIAGQKPKRTFLNRFTECFFTELDKGIESPYILLTGGVFFSLVAWRVSEHFVVPRQERLAHQVLTQRVPMQATHNAFWGFGSNDPSMQAAAGTSGSHYSPQETTEETEERMRRPQLIHTETSELREQRTAANPTGEVDVVCLELSEYDPTLQDDIYYRSVHYVPYLATATAAAVLSNNEHHNDRGSYKKGAAETERSEEAAAAVAVTAATSSPFMTEAKEPYEENTDYLQFMPDHGEDVVYGMAKCKAVTSKNNCIPYAGNVELEQERKLMLTLGPVHILRDPAKTTFPFRFTFVKQPTVEALLVGLHSGELARWLTSSFPNVDLDVVEPDGALVRMCRRFLGFKESSNLHLFIDDPVNYIRNTSAYTSRDGGGAGKQAKRYDLVLVNAVDGAGHLSTQYGRLEFINNIRNSMSNEGCVAIAIPNQDANFLYTMAQNWRMAFADRTVLLIHCITAPCTILMTFQDNATRGKTKFGSVSSVDEFRDLQRTVLIHYGPNRVQFDLTSEVNQSNFRVLEPGKAYKLDMFLPVGHPATAAERQKNAPKRRMSWGDFLRKAAGAYLSPTQRADVRASQSRKGIA